MVSVLASSAVDRGFIGGVMISVLASSAVDRGFIGGVMISVLASSAVDRGFEPRWDHTKDYENHEIVAHSINEKEQRLVGSESG